MMILKMIRHNGDMRIVEVENVEVRNRSASAPKMIEVDYVTSHDHETWTCGISEQLPSYGITTYCMVILESNGKTSEIIRPSTN